MHVVSKQWESVKSIPQKRGLLDPAVFSHSSFSEVSVILSDDLCTNHILLLLHTLRRTSSTTATTLGSHQYGPCPNSRRSTRAAATATAARRYGSGSGGRGLGPLSAHPRNAVGRATPGGGRAEEHDEEEQATSASSPAGGRLRNDHGGFVAEENGDDERVREGRTDSPERVLGGPRAIHADNNNKGGINSVADTAARHRGNECSSAVGASTVPRNENFARSAGGAGGAGAGEIEGGGGTDRARFVRALAAMVTAPLFTRVMSGGGGGGGGGLGVLPAGAVRVASYLLILGECSVSLPLWVRHIL